MIDALTQNGTLHPTAGPLPGATARPDPSGGTPIPLVIKDGLVTFGPFTIGQVPDLR